MPASSTIGSRAAPGRPRACLLAHPSAYEAGGAASLTAGEPTRLRLCLEPDYEAAAKARAALHRLGEELEDRVVQDLDLVVTELVTNSVRHADAPAGEPVRVEVSITAERVLAAVEDAGSGRSPALRSAGAGGEGGWGLHLVDRVSSRWGVERNGRTRVWLELERGASRAGAPRRG